MGRILNIVVVAAILYFVAPKMWQDYQDSRHNASWPTVTGSLDEIRVKEVVSTDTDAKGQTSSNTSFHLAVRYSYQVDGRRYEGQRVRIGGRSYHSESNAIAAMRVYERSKFVTVYYDPQKPESSVLEPG